MLIRSVPIHLRGGDGVRQSALGELPVQYPDMRLDNLGQAIDEYILDILSMEQAVQSAALCLNAEPKGCGRLTVGLTHCNNVVVGGGHYGVGGILG